MSETPYLTTSKSNLSATITRGPVPTDGSAGCPRCLVVASGVPISQVFWISSTLKLTLDTEYVTVTQYNGSAVTGTTVVTGDLDTIDPATVSKAYSMALTIEMPDPYEGIGPGMILANGRDGKINDALSIPYPTPYLGIAGVQVWTQTILSQTSSGSVVNNCPLKTFNIFAGGYSDDSLSCIQVFFSNTYYEVLTSLEGEPWMSTSVNIDTASFSSWVMSNETFVKQYPELSQCTFIAPAFGPPGVKVPVSALTDTTTTTVQGSMYANSQQPQPASTLASITAQQTTTPKSPSPTEMLPSIQYQSSTTLSESRTPVSSVQKSHNSPKSALSVATLTDDTQSTPETSTPVMVSSYVHTQVAPSTFESSTHNSAAASAIVVAGQTLSQEASPIIDSSSTISFAVGGGKTVIGSSVDAQAELSSETTLQVPVLTYGGSANTGDVSSHIVVADQTLVPGSAITISGTLVSLATDASSVVIGGNVEQLTDIYITPTAARTADGPVYQIAGQTLKPGGTVTVSGTQIYIPSGASVAVIGSSSSKVLAAATPAATLPIATCQEITFGDQTYTASGSTPEFVIASQTLTPNGVVTVSGTPIRLPSGASFVVVGSSTQSLAPIIATSPGIVATAAEVTFGGKIYSASGATPEFIIAGQTLTQNGAVTVSGTTIRIPSGASVVIVGTSTQSLATIVATSVAEVATAGEITFGGKTYTADTASQFRIGGQTLVPGGVITVDGTQVSYAPEATDVVVGSSTEPVNIGTIIMGGFGQPSQTGSEPFTGASNSNIQPRVCYWIGLALCVAVIFC